MKSSMTSPHLTRPDYSEKVVKECSQKVFYVAIIEHKVPYFVILESIQNLDDLMAGFRGLSSLIFGNRDESAFVVAATKTQSAAEIQLQSFGRQPTTFVGSEIRDE